MLAGIRAELPKRYRPVYDLVLAGRRNGEIASELGLAQHTVENYVSGILEIAGCRDRVELILMNRVGRLSG